MFSLVWHYIVLEHELPSLVALLVAVIAAGAPLSRLPRIFLGVVDYSLFCNACLLSNNGGWRTVFYVAGRLCLILFAISIGQASFSVAGIKGSQHGTIHSKYIFA